MEPIRFNGQVTREDFRAAFPRLRRGLPLWSGPAVCLAMLAWHVARVGVCLLDAASTAFWALLLSMDAFSQMGFRAQWLRAWVDETNFEFGDFEFCLRTSKQIASCRWSQLDRLVQTPDSYLLIVGAVAFEPFRLYLIPRRLMTPAVEAAWRELAERELASVVKKIERC